jgi:hypothetical protein
MKITLRNYFFAAYIFGALSFSLNSFSQISEETIIRGRVTDALTGYPIPFASVFLKGTTIGTLTDNNGIYRIESNLTADTITCSFIGYRKESRGIRIGVEQTIDMQMALTSINLDEVIIKAKKKDYSNKNNPAVQLIEKVVEKKDENRPESFNYLEYKTYEKVQFAFSNVTENFKNSKAFSDFSFMFDNIDTTKRIGNDILPMFIKESLSAHYFKKEPEESKEILLAEKSINLDEYLNNKGASAYLNYLYQNINIYDNEILFLTNKFLSPIANTAPLFYRYYIIDTLPVADINCIRLFFEPRNKSDFLFHGNLYITMDTSYAVKKIDIGINKAINIDWVQDISITQDFEKSGNRAWLLSKEEISIDFGIVKNSMGLYGQRTISFKDYKINEPISEEIFQGPAKVEKINPASEEKGFWEENRYVPLSKSESQIYSTIDSLKQIPDFRRKMDILMLLSVGFLDLGKIEIGPVSSFYSYNSVEGSRFRFGGRTTTDFSKKLTLDGFVAYGSKDHMYKYNAGITYSLTDKTIYQFPVKYIRLNYMKDVRIPGQEFQFAQADNILFSFKRGVDDKRFLNNTVKLEYLNEFENHFSYMAGYSFTQQSAVGNLHFIRSENGTGTGTNEISYINVSELYLNLRYAPNETIYQGKHARVTFPNKFPIIQLKIAGGSQALNGDYDYLRLQFNISRRYYVSIFGYTDVSFEAGKIFGQVPYPLLFEHRANQTYSYQKNAYNLMNFLEFVSDRYVSLNIDHSFNGFIFNKIPLIKKLKLRELITCKVLYGKLYNSNNPDYESELFLFPTDGAGVPLTYTLENKPYIEGSLGVSNVFRILRVDFIKRFTYLDNPNVADFGIRVQLRLDI